MPRYEVLSRLDHNTFVKGRRVDVAVEPGQFIELTEREAAAITGGLDEKNRAIRLAPVTVAVSAADANKD